MNTYDYRRLSELHVSIVYYMCGSLSGTYVLIDTVYAHSPQLRTSKLYDKIITEIRADSQYFKVSFYGGFPPFFKVSLYLIVMYTYARMSHILYMQY